MYVEKGKMEERYMQVYLMINKRNYQIYIFIAFFCFTFLLYIYIYIYIYIQTHTACKKSFATLKKFYF